MNEGRMKKKILVVDDDTALAEMTRALLEETGVYQVLCVTRSAEVILSLRNFQPDLVLMDICMPEMDGMAVAEKMKADPILSKIPLIFLTSLVTEEETQERKGVVGGYPFIAKPVKAQELLERISRELN